VVQVLFRATAASLPCTTIFQAAPCVMMMLLQSAFFASVLRVGGAAFDSRCDVDRVNGRSLSWSEFHEEYYEKQPVVLTHLIDDWPARKKSRWTMENILDKYGNYTFEHADISGNNCRIDPDVCEGLTLREYFNSSSNTSWLLQSWSHAMTRDVTANKDWKIPKILRPVTYGGPHLALAGRMQGNIMHTHDNNWLAQVYGRKRWVVAPPDQTGEKDVHFSRMYDEATCTPRPLEKGMLACTVNAGEIMYLPSKWSHETCSLDEFNIGIGFIGSVGKMGGHQSRSMKARVAARLGDIDFLESLEGMMDPELYDLAARGGHSKVMSLMMERDTTGKMGPKVDHYITAAKFGQLELLEFFDNNMTVGMEDTKALELAAGHGQLGSLRYLLNNFSQRYEKVKDAAVLMAAKHGHVSSVKLLQEGMPKSSMRPMFQVGLAEGHVPIARYALKAGARRPVSAQVLTQAAERGHTHVLAFMRKKLGVDWALSGATPLHAAAENGHVAALRVMVNHRADLTARNTKKLQPLHVAVSEGHSRVTDFILSQAQGRKLLEAKADGNWRPLHKAAQLGYDAVARLLLASKAKVDAPNAIGKTPLDLAKAAGHSSTVKLLKQAGKKSAGTGEL